MCLLSSQSVWISPFLVLPLLLNLLCQVGFVIGNPSVSRLEILGRRPFIEEWVFISDVHTDEQAPIDDPVLQSTDYSDCIHGTTRISKQCDPVPCEPTIPRDKPYFGNDWRHHSPLRPRPKCNLKHPQQLSPFPERLELPFSSDAILSGYEDVASSGSDHFTMWE